MHLASMQISVRNQSSRESRKEGKRFGRTATKGLLTTALLAVSGCGANYRPVISAISPVGPAAQPQKFAVAISDPNLGGPGTLPGLVTFVDFSGDTVLITANIGVKPKYLILGAGGGTGLTLNGDGTLNSFGISPGLLSSAVQQTTLLPNSTLPTSIFPQGMYTYVTQPARSSVAELTGSPLTLQQELSPVGPSPVYIAGVASAPRVYVLSPSATEGGLGTATALETSTNTPSNPQLPVGVNPVYGVMTADTRRAFIMNQGSNTISVIDAQNNQLDPGVANGTIQDPAAIAPLWADFAPTLSELVVANQGDGTSNGSVSIFSIPLCSAGSLPTNPNCNPNNPIDAVGFGSLVANVPVGKNPLMVAVLQDGTQAYVINQSDSTVSVINMKTNAVTATISVAATTPNPTFIAVTTGTPTGKVYVTSTTSSTMTVIRTDTNAVDTTIPLQGYGIQVRVTQP